MKIQYLLTSADSMGGTERAVLTQASLLAPRHDVEVVSVFRTRARQFFAVPDGVRLRHLVDATKPAAPRPVAERALSAEDCVALAALPSQYVEPSWEGVFNRLSDLELERLLRETDADIVVTPTPALMALAVQLVPARVKTVHQEHRVSELRGVSGEPLLRYAPALDALVALTTPTQEWFAETFGAQAPRLATIPNAVPDGFRPGSTRVNPVVAMAGRLVPEKQIHHAIRAFAQLVDEFPEWTLRVYGEGPKLSELRNMIDEFELNDNVHLFGNAPRMEEEWARASICLLTSRVEAFPLVLTEAKAAGLPCVAYDCPNGPGELIRDGVDGYLVALDDVDGLATALGRLMGDQALRDRFGTAALDGIDELAPERVGAAWESLFEDVLAAAAEPGAADARSDRFARHLAHSSGGNAVLAAPPAHGTRRIANFSYKAHQVRIEALHQNLRRHAGQVCLVADDLTTGDVIDRNLHLVLDVLDKYGIPYVYLNDGNLRHQLGVAEEHRQGLLDALSETYADEAVYVAALNAGGGVMKTAMAGTLAAWHLVKAPSGVRVFQPIVSHSGTVRFSGVYGTTVSFWADSEDGRDVETPAATTLGRVLPKESLVPALLEVAGRDVTTIEPFTRTLVSAVDFPVDAVYTWVDGNDPAWTERRNEALVARGFQPVAGASGDARYRDRDELRYSLRSIDMYAPWIRTIYLVTDRQTPAWLDTDHPRVEVVDHRDIFTDPDALPTFNSHAIESQLHHIDGLAEHFLYFNDDVFLGRPVTPATFFHANGLAKHFTSPTTVPMTAIADDDEFNMSAAKNNRALIADRFGKTLVSAFLHTPHPLRRSVLAEMETEFAEILQRTAGSPLRSHGDVSVASSLHHYYAFLTGRSVPGAISCGFVNVGLREQQKRLTRLLSARPHDVFCLNDYHDGDVPADEQARVIHAFLTEYFPVPSQFETGTVRNRTARAVPGTA